jgi:hypothetical protein
MQTVITTPGPNCASHALTIMRCAVEMEIEREGFGGDVIEMLK